ncbi:phage holin family protein [Rhodobacter calidifons]|uniref:Phage holin family protein n=1 Tax=Rhodobacter calidifons TaxID=2715277 RepID=A0ABX0G464_9RHOB|nr:phage holin family protein [Rhodobacter calidifons]NHB76007.1 phage holin family protein [Rhodobacter calidifons]
MRDHSADQANAADSGLAGLLLQVVSGVGRLVQGELQLARAEAADSLRSVTSGLGKLAGAAVVALVGLNVLAGAAVGALVHAGLGPVWAALIVGGLMLLLALGLAAAGRAGLRLRGRRPGRLLRGLGRDVAAVRSGFGRKET